MVIVIVFVAFRRLLSIRLIRRGYFPGGRSVVLTGTTNTFPVFALCMIFSPSEIVTSRAQGITLMENRRLTRSPL